MVKLPLYKSPSITLQLFFLCLLPLSASWGNLAHRAVALVAEKHIMLSTTQYVHSLLDNTSLSDAAVWADVYKLLPEGRYTSGWHYINTHDDPPRACIVSYSYDADHPCIIDAIVNVTRRVSDVSLEHTERKMAFMFLVHLIGDLHCPLHVEGLLRGGNDIPVIWEGRETSLHFIWDVSIPQKLTNSTEEDEETAALAWAEKLSNQQLDSKSSKGQWPIKTNHEMWGLLGDEEGLALSWAKDANFFVCRTVLKDGVDGVRGKELSSHYYGEAAPVVEYLVRNAGLRLAALIDELAREERFEQISSEQGVLK